MQGNKAAKIGLNMQLNMFRKAVEIAIKRLIHSNYNMPNKLISILCLTDKNTPEKYTKMHLNPNHGNVLKN